MKIIAQAPVRISFCGGGTDLAAYYEEYGGIVLSAAIDTYSHAELLSRDDEKIEISSPDYGVKVSGRVGQTFPLNGTLDLLKAAVNARAPSQGCTLTTYQDVPSASGLGTSASMAVAILGALSAFIGQPLDKTKLAEEAYSLEMNTLKTVTGKQDQYASSFGGINVFIFPKKSEGTVVDIRRIELDAKKKLRFLDQLLLVNIGGAHISGDLQRSLLTNMETRVPEALEGLEGLKTLTYQMISSLQNSQWDKFGGSLHQAFMLKKMSNPQVSNQHIEAVYALARKHGALGGKISGAGGSGNLLLFCLPEKKAEILHTLERIGGRNISFVFDEEGLVVQ